jgi:universal stress protein E
MKLLEHLLVATDFSPGCDEALAMAVETARRFGSEITLLHVLVETSDTPLLHDMLKEKVTERLEAIQQELENQGLQASIAVEHGIPHERIVRFADARDVNAILLGAVGVASPQDCALGVIAERILHKARKPVWIVKPGAKPDVKRILCAVDYSKSSRRALGNAIHLARKFHADLAVLHVTTAPDESIAHPTAAGVGPQVVKPPAVGHAAQADDQTKLNAFILEHDLTGVRWSRLIRHGKPHAEILAAVAEEQIDLLVMGTVGKSAFARMIVGSVTTKVVRSLPCSMIATKAEDLIRLRLDREVTDLKTHYDQGLELLEQGFAQQARADFEYCLENDPFYAPAWDQLAIVNEHLGDPDEAHRCRMRARDILESLWSQRIEADIRHRYHLTPKKSETP